MARLTIHGADAMTAEDRLEVARWLHAQAASLTRDGSNYSGRFTARYYAR